MKNKDTVLVQVSPPVMQNIGQTQDSPPVKEDMDPIQVVNQGTGESKMRDLDQASPQVLNNMGLVWVTHHTMESIVPILVILLVKGNLDPVQVVNLDVVNNKTMVLNEDIHQTMKHMGLNHAGP